MLSTIGTAVGAAGQIASAFGGSRRSRTKALRQDRRHLYKQARELPEQQVEGFKRAGIHPLFGMSGGTAQYSAPSSITSNDDSLGTAMQKMGNGIGRASEALASNRERLQNRLLETQVDGQELENTKKAADLQLLKHAQTPGLNNNPIDTVQMGLNQDGSYTYLPSQDMADLMEGAGEVGSIPLIAEWYLRNKLPLHRNDVTEWMGKKTRPHLEKFSKNYSKYVPKWFKSMANKYVYK